MSDNPEVNALQAALAEPFDPREVEWLPKNVSGNRALAVAYIDARCVMTRLDAVVGLAGWQDDYEVLADGNVICRLRLRLGGEWVTKADVGGESDQKDEGNRRKASFSDALKRAAVKWGVGRYLYSLPVQWCDYDPQKRKFVRLPTLPPDALPGRAGSAAPATRNGPAPQGLPADGAEFERRIAAHDVELTNEGVCKQGQFMRDMRAWGHRKMGNGDVVRWPADVFPGAAKAWASIERGYLRALIDDTRAPLNRSWREILVALDLDPQQVAPESLNLAQLRRGLRMLRQEAPAAAPAAAGAAKS